MWSISRKNKMLISSFRARSPLEKVVSDQWPAVMFETIIGHWDTDHFVANILPA